MWLKQITGKTADPYWLSYIRFENFAVIYFTIYYHIYIDLVSYLQISKIQDPNLRFLKKYFNLQLIIFIKLLVIKKTRPFSGFRSKKFSELRSILLPCLPWQKFQEPDLIVHPYELPCNLF